MFKKVYECENEVCKAQGVSIYEVRIEVRKIILGNGNPNPCQLEGQPKSVVFQVCNAKCALVCTENKIAKLFDEPATQTQETKETNNSAKPL